jgi:Mg/Co/Ni transporter MgtE
VYLKRKVVMPHHHLDRKVKTCMTQIKTVVFEDQSIEQAIKILREKHISEKVLYFYVVDSDFKLKGLVTTRDLLLKESDTIISADKFKWFNHSGNYLKNFDNINNLLLI